MERFFVKCFILVFLLGSIHGNSFSESFSFFIKGKIQKEKKLPTTFDDAVNYIIAQLNDTDKTFIKSFPKCELIVFHHGWGTGIRNGLGLWGKNPDLLKSCAQKEGKDRIHPDDASMLIINGVWDKLNEGLELVDFSSIEPTKYFDAIWSIMQKARNENISYLASLPEWIYNVRRLSFSSDSTQKRNKMILSEAKKLANSYDKKAFLGLLYLVYFNSNIKETSFFLEKNLEIDNSFVELPSFYYPNIRLENLIIRTINPKTEAKIVTYNWNHISLQELSVKCYGSLNEKYFASFDEYKKWTQLTKENYLLTWKNKTDISADDYKTLIQNPRRLLEILILTKQYFYFDEGNHGLTTGPYAKSKKSIKTLLSFLGFNDTILKDYPYNKEIEILGRCIDEDYQTFQYRATYALKSIADRLSTDEIFDILSPNAIEEYNANIKNEDLSDYKILGGFLFATQYTRIINKDSAKAFEVCYYYWKNQFISWPMMDYFIELLFQINKKKAFDLSFEYFKTIPKEGSFTRNGLLTAIIKYDFTGNEYFIENWYWTVYDKGFNYHPKEPELILSLLKDTDAETFKLYSKIVSDKRYKNMK